MKPPHASLAPERGTEAPIRGRADTGRSMGAPLRGRGLAAGWPGAAAARTVGPGNGFAAL
eukprot:627249-Heterocapsa_arctica.AAC.1